MKIVNLSSIAFVVLSLFVVAAAWSDEQGNCAAPAASPAAIDWGNVQWLVEKEGTEGTEKWLSDKARRGKHWSKNWAMCFSPFGRLYWGYLATSGKLEGYVKGLAERIKRTPADSDLVFEYIGARSQLPEQQQVPLTWLAETCRLDQARYQASLRSALSDPYRSRTGLAADQPSVGARRAVSLNR